MKILKLWSIQRWDGGDRTDHVVYADNIEMTKEYLHKNEHDSVFEKTLVVVSSMTELGDYLNGEIRARALAKLTPEERYVLNVE